MRRFRFRALRGQSWRELSIRTCRKSWDDEVFGQAARLAFYYFLSMFPALLLLLIVLGQLNRRGSGGSELQDTLVGAVQQILPGETAALIARTVGQLNAEALVGAGAVFAALSSVWAALNGTWAMIAGLNTAYEVEEERPWWKVLSIAFGLTVSMGIMGIAALWIMYYGSRAGRLIGHEFQNHGHSPLLWRFVQALGPLAGQGAYWLFTLALVGTGMLAVPVLAGSCAYAIAEAATWRKASLSESGSRAPRFYAVIATAMLIGLGLDFAGLNAVKMLFWSAVVNGVLAPPLVVLVVMLTSDRKVMGERINSLTARTLGWICAAVMTVAAVAMLIL